MKTLLLCTCSLVVIIAVHCASATQSNNNHNNIIEWHHANKENDVVAPNDPIGATIKLHLPLRNTHLVLDGQSQNKLSIEELTQLADSIGSACNFDKQPQATNFDTKNIDDNNDRQQQRLALWRRIVAPSCEQIAAAQKTIDTAQLSAFCQKRREVLDSFTCSPDTPQHLLASLLNVQFQRVEEQLSGSVRLSAINSDRMTVPAGFEFVSNVKVRGASEQPRLSRRRSLLQQQQQQAADSENQALLLQFPYPHNDGSLAPQLVDLGLHHDKSLDPSEGFFGFDSIMTTLKCSDGNPAYYNTAIFSAACHNTSATLPDLVQFQVVEINNGNKSSSINDDTPPAAEYNFTSVAPSCFVETLRLPNTTVVCFFTVLPEKQQRLSVSPKQYLLRTRGRFSDNNSSSSSKYTEWSYAKTFFNGEFAEISEFHVVPGPLNNQQEQPPSVADLPGYFPHLDSKHLLYVQTSGRTLFPHNYREMYGIPANEPVSVESGVAMGIWEIGAYPPKNGGSSPLGPAYNSTDLRVFMARISPAIGSRWKESLVQYVGAPYEIAVGGESQLDIQTVMSVAPAIPTILWTSNITSLASMLESWSDFTQDLVDHTGPVKEMKDGVVPTVWSASYNLCLNHSDPSILALAQRAALNLALLSASGTTFFISSGDDGSSCDADKETQNDPAWLFWGGFPGAIPHAVSVGATAYFEGDERQGCDAGRGDFITSGGGRIPYFDMPSWQRAALGSALNSSYAGHRLIPDIAAIGTQIFTVYDGNNMTTAGTSFSAPFVAALFALVNNRLKSNSEIGETLTHASEFIYNNTHLWRDITKGSGAFGRGGALTVPHNYICHVVASSGGYDFSTGLGEVSSFEDIAAAAEQWMKASNNNKGSTTTTAATTTASSSVFTTTISSEATTTTTSQHTASTSAEVTTSTSTTTKSAETTSSATSPPTTTTSSGGGNNNNNNGNNNATNDDNKGSSVSVAELIGASVGALVVGIVLGAAGLYLSQRRGSGGDGDYHPYRSELQTDAGGGHDGARDV